jgi:hypothetical protein
VLRFKKNFEKSNNSAHEYGYLAVTAQTDPESQKSGNGAIESDNFQYYKCRDQLQKCRKTRIIFGKEHTGPGSSLEVFHFGWLHRKCTVKTITNMRFEKASMRIRG